MLKQLTMICVASTLSLGGFASQDGRDELYLCSPAGCTQNRAPPVDMTALFQTANDIALARGFQTIGMTSSGALDAGQSSGVPYWMKAGDRYLVVGLCDTQCSNLDIDVHHLQGSTEIASDTGEDASPIVELSPDEDTSVIVRAKMIRCDLEPCQYGVAVYRK